MVVADSTRSRRAERRHKDAVLGLPAVVLVAAMAVAGLGGCAAGSGTTTGAPAGSAPSGTGPQASGPPASGGPLATQPVATAPPDLPPALSGTYEDTLTTHPARNEFGAEYGGTTFELACATTTCAISMVGGDKDSPKTSTGTLTWADGRLSGPLAFIEAGECTAPDATMTITPGRDGILVASQTGTLEGACHGRVTLAFNARRRGPAAPAAPPCGPGIPVPADAQSKVPKGLQPTLPVETVSNYFGFNAIVCGTERDVQAWLDGLASAGVQRRERPYEGPNGEPLVERFSTDGTYRISADNLGEDRFLVSILECRGDGQMDLCRP